MAPLARRDLLLTQQVGDELVVYDEKQDVAHRLNRPAATVWKLADGQRSISDLASLMQEELGGSVDESVVYVALDELNHANLLVSGLPPEMEVMSRRAMMATVATLVPVVASIRLNAQTDMPLCNFSVSPTNFPNVAAAGATLTVQVSATGSTCITNPQPWTSSSPPGSFLQVSGSGTSLNLLGPVGTATITVPVNATGQTRTGQVTIAGQTVSVTQLGGTAQPCGTAQVAGGDAPETRSINLGKTSGTVVFSWNMQTIQDRMIVKYLGGNMTVDGQSVAQFDTGCVSGAGSKSLTFSGGSSVMEVQVIPNCANPNGIGTDWKFSITCA